MRKKTSKQSEKTEMEPEFELLNSIKKVEVSPFLITRITQKIENQIQSISPRLAYSLGLGFFIVILLNVFVLVNNTQLLKQQDNLAKSMRLLPENTSYK